MFDYYGDNPAHYNTLEPPRYALDTFQAPALLSWGANDKLADPKVGGATGDWQQEPYGEAF